MKAKLDIYFSKVFCRMRHKTQLFNGDADDHYHTRLQHTIEVESIAINICNKIMLKYPSFTIDLNKVSLIALLHDIGHTPFGHAGERALHEMTSGQCYKQYGLPNFKKSNVAIGFKHNLNSGLLYTESVIFDDVDYEVLDGIIKHTKLRYGKRDRLDYGFEYIFSNRKSDYKNNVPCTTEGFIVAFADEIAQICSDYLDICLDAKSRGKIAIFNCEPFTSLDVDSSEDRVVAKAACDYLIDLFVNSFKPNILVNTFKKKPFAITIKQFDLARSKYIDNNKRIKSYDKAKDKIAKSLFALYYLYPNEMNADFFNDLAYRLRRIKYCTNYVFTEMENNIGLPQDTIKYINFVSNIVFTNSSYVSGARRKDYKLIMRMYIRSIAVYISKMTDNYAIHKYRMSATANLATCSGEFSQS